MPRFLDLAFTFGEQEAEKDFHYTAFNAENFLESSDAEKYCIPRLGRSGHEIRHCFNLWSVEKSDRPPYWPIRQTAVYHSFDVCTGRTAWINIKGNELMQKRITQALGSTSQLQPSSLKTISGAFSASLLTLLIVLEWSAENWKSRINDLQKQLSDILMKAKNAPFKSIEEALRLDANALLQQLSETEEKARKQPRRIDSLVSARTPRRTDTLQSVLSSVSPKRILSGLSRASTSVDPEKRDSPVLAKAKTPPSPIMLEPLQTSPTLLQQAPVNSEATYQSQFSVLQEFTVGGLQKLTDVSSRIHEVKLVMKLNTEVIHEIIDYYKMLAESDDMPMDIRKDCAADLNSFFRRARAVIRHLEMEQSRSDTLMRMFEDGKSLVSVNHILNLLRNRWLTSKYQFDNIVQFRNIEVNKLFAINAHQSGKHVLEMTEEMHQSSMEMEKMTKSMKKVAEKTAIQTSSMHLITLVTLFFLPATFVAVRIFRLPSFSFSELADYLTSDQTFFSSGAFQWDQENPNGQSMPFWKPQFFTLFAAICFPMTGIIILIWWALYWRNNRKRRQHAEGDEESQNITGVKPIRAS